MMTERRSTFVRTSVFIFIGLLILGSMYTLSQINFLLFHSLAEGFSIVVACGIFMIAWNSRAFHSNGYLAFLGIAYLAVALIDFMHLLSYKGMGVFAGGGSNMSIQFWLSARVVESVTLALAPLFLARMVPIRLVTSGYLAALAILIPGVMANIFPPLFIEGEGLTLIKVVVEYLICLTMLFAGFFTYRRRELLDKNVLTLYLTAIGVTILSDLAFTLYVDLYGVMNAVGHFLKIISFCLIYQAIIAIGLERPYSLMFRDLKSSEMALRSSERTIRTILRTVGEGILVMSKDSKIEMVNQEVCVIFGYEPEQMRGVSITVLMPEEYRQRYEVGISRYLAGGAAKVLGKRIELEGERKDGSRFPLELRIEESSYGQRRFFTAAMRDITERKQVEQQLHTARDRAEEATRLKDKFVSLVAHDLKSPLGAQTGLLRQVLSHESSSRLNERSRSALARILTSGESMQQMIDSLLSTSRISSGQIELRARFIDGHRIVEEAIDAVCGAAQMKKIEIDNNMPERLRLYADPDLLREVVQNLITNGVKFSHPGDAVCIFRPDGIMAAIAVTDTGAGIAQNRIDSLFRYEVKTSTVGTGGEVGAGLGLPLSRELVVAHGGELTVESTEGEGSCFTVKLPSMRPRILLAGGSDSSRSSWRGLLGTECVELIEITDRATMDKTDGIDAHLAIVGLDGYGPKDEEFLRSIRCANGSSPIPIIGVADDTKNLDRAAAVIKGCDGFIPAPFVSEAFLRLVRRFIMVP